MCPREENEEENELLITKVVEYVEPVAAQELLCKFPDNSAFDFDYTQSSIWSPLVPRAYKSMHFDFDIVMNPRKRRLSFEMESKRLSFKNVTSSIKKRVVRTAFDMNLNLIMGMKKKKIKGSEHSLNPYPSKGWTKVLKAASKHFKRKKKRDPPAVHVKL